MKTKHLLTISLSLTGLLLLQGCAVPHSYPNPKFAASAADISKPAKARPVTLSVVALRKGEPIGVATRLWQDKFERALNASGVFAVTRSGPADEIQITMRNDGSLAGTAGRSIGSGASFGLIGSTTDDDYAITATYRRSDGRTYSRNYSHQIQTVIGKTDKIPAGAPMSPADAMDKVANDIILRLIKDIQSSTGKH